MALRDDNFYVYILFRDGGMVPFYIGMGRGSRWNVHCYRFGDSPYRDNIIKKMKLDGVSVPKIKAASGLSRNDAVALEISLIESFGRKDIGTGILANLTAGGGGTHEAVVTDEMRTAQSSRHTAWMAAHPEWRKKHSELQKLHMTDPVNRERSKKAAQKAWCNPAYRENLTAIHKLRAQGPERVRLKNMRDAHFATPGAREAAAIKAAQQYKRNPELRSAIADRFKLLWANPEWRATLLAKRALKQVRGPREHA